MVRNSPPNTLDGEARVRIRVTGDDGVLTLAREHPVLAREQSNGEVRITLGERDGKARVLIVLPIGALVDIPDPVESPEQIRHRAELAEASYYARLEL